MSSTILFSRSLPHQPSVGHAFATYWMALLLTALISFFAIESVTAAESVNGPVNVNEADVVTLAAELTGVGPQLARRIVEFRERHGDFETLEALKDVKGIGDALLVKNADNIILD